MPQDIFKAWKHHNAKENLIVAQMLGAPKVADPKLCGCSCPEQEAMSQPEKGFTTFTLGGFRYELLLEMRNLIPLLILQSSIG